MKKILYTFTFILIITLLAGLILPQNNDSSGSSNQNKEPTNSTQNSGNTSVDNEKTTLVYSALGDSITFGAIPNGGGAQMENPYPTLVGEIIGATKVNNYGIAGSTVASGENSLKPMCTRYSGLAKNSDIISVMGGINDIGKHIPLGTIDDYSNETFYGALNNLAYGLKTNYKDAFIFFIIPLPNSATYESETHLPYYNAVRNVCNKYKIPYFDAYKECGFENVMYNNGKDTTHPDQEFHSTVLAPMIAQFIKDNYTK